MLAKEEEAENDDAPTVEMEAAFEESIQEEEITHDEPQWQLSTQYNAANEDGSEVGEEMNCP